MKNSFVRAIFAFLAVAALAACGSNNNNSTTPSGPSCGLPTTFTAVYPINGSTTVPTNAGYLYIATQNTNIANGNYSTAVQPPNGLPAYFGGPFVQVTLASIPKPRTLPTFSSPIYYRSLIAYSSGGLISGATYQIGFNNGNSNCTPKLIDTFTTQ
jgi:hypothetical protein